MWKSTGINGGLMEKHKHLTSRYGCESKLGPKWYGLPNTWHQVSPTDHFFDSPISLKPAHANPRAPPLGGSSHLATQSNPSPLAGPWASAGTAKDQTLDLVPEVVTIQKCRRNHGQPWPTKSNQGIARKMQLMTWIPPSKQHAQTRFFACHPRMNRNTGSLYFQDLGFKGFGCEVCKGFLGFNFAEG